MIFLTTLWHWTRWWSRKIWECLINKSIEIGKYLWRFLVFQYYTLYKYILQTCSCSILSLIIINFLKHFFLSRVCFSSETLKMHAKEVELFRNVSVHEFYRLKALITLKQVNTSVKTSMVRLTLEQVNTSVVEKKKNLYEQTSTKLRWWV